MEFRLHVSTIVQRGDKILLVQEAKEKIRGKWNLPGGHLEVGEEFILAAKREVKEETFLAVEPHAFLGAYVTKVGSHSICFVFLANSDVGEPKSGDQILDTRWFTVEEISALSDEELLNAPKLRQVFADYESAKSLPMDAIVEIN